jgi:hypothetical protein
MSAIRVVFGNVVDDDGFVALPYFMADGGFELKFPAGCQAECDFIAHRAAYPSLFGDARDGGKTHAGRPADHLKNPRNRRDALHGGDVRAKVGRYDLPFEKFRLNANAGAISCREIYKAGTKTKSGA